MPNILRVVLAWCVHLYTATGLLVAAGMAVLIVSGKPEDLLLALALMLLATFIDSTDGALARLAEVKRYAPSFDGRRLDDLVDFQTYTSLPLLLIWRAGLLPGPWAWLLLLPLLASAYGFSQVSAKTDDGYFLGFPSYWNVVAIYLYLLRPETMVSVLVITGFSILTFVPTRYLYPSQRTPFSRLTIMLSLIWAVLLAVIILGQPHGWEWLTWGSLAFPAYYLLMSWGISVAIWRRKEGEVVSRR
ncbi:MAG: CDP-alcohol phosphatidyltransferase family protein [Pyrinomonadaceae bacterium]